MNSKLITDYDIQAFIDNELSCEQEKKVLSYLNDNETAMQRYEELKTQKKAIQDWFKSLH